ncbi:MAG: copper chaperone PCu(A)C [Gammaproteobacteria bacterium]|nr:MAG: copper chaperone PCu(A)C [Gammaproteobacteria bacterium]
MMNKKILSALFSLLFIAQANADIIVYDPWIRSAPVNAPVLGVFMQIDNQTDKDIKLLAAYAQGYQRVEIHRTVNDDGLMKMVKQLFAPIPAGERLILKPGSWHMMLIKPKKVPDIGSTVAVKLEFDNGTVQTVNAQVKSGKKMHMNNHEH